jgi:hypothetical protein
MIVSEVVSSEKRLSRAFGSNATILMVENGKHYFPRISTISGAPIGCIPQPECNRGFEKPDDWICGNPRGGCQLESPEASEGLVEGSEEHHLHF